MSALIEHVRSSILYERQHLRELETLRTDVANAAKPAAQVKTPVAPRPTVVPPLEDFSKPPMPRPASAQPTASPPQTPSWRPPFPSAAAAASGPPVQHVSSIPPSPATPAPVSAIPTIPASPARSVDRGPLLPSQVLPPQSPGAGPSSAPATQSSFNSPLGNGGPPPLGGRFVDGTKSMFIKHTPSPLAGSPFPNSPLTPSKSAGFQSPLHAPFTPAAAASPHPLAQSMSASLETNTSARGGPSLANDLDPLGSGKPAYMSASVRVQPTRPRLDAREAASKLANMF